MDTQALLDLVEKAGDAIMVIYAQDIEVSTKDDDSPLTKADLASHRVLTEGLARLTPEIPVFSEEGAQQPYAERRGWQRYWLIDPLDGTKEFINRNGEFTVNLALIEGNAAVFGIVGVPAQGVLYWGDIRTGEAWRRAGDKVERIHTRDWQVGEPLTVVASRSHGGERLETYLEQLAGAFGSVDRTPVGSSLKLCILAEGRADLYPRLGPTSEWDIAAAHAVLKAAGGDVWAASGDDLSYNAKESVLNPEFIAVADAKFGWRQKLPAVPA
ncbi:MAG: 3'(2'),5'-bisphosphate nucleotidase CysQ [Pseudomonadales bacterium]|nr:3'(2'),5'-bisphosphate nucleotidase CysQ [Pseudomonadales bacterium]